MGHGVGPYLGLNEIGSLNPMMNFITINYLFNCIFWIYPLVLLDLSIRIFGIYLLGFLLVPINSTLCYCF